MHLPIMLAAILATSSGLSTDTVVLLSFAFLKGVSGFWRTSRRLSV